MNKKIVGYYVSEKSTLKELMADVWRLIGEGWTPCGGATKTNNYSGIGHWFYQAMVKYETE